MTHTESQMLWFRQLRSREVEEALRLNGVMKKVILQHGIDILFITT